MKFTKESFKNAVINIAYIIKVLFMFIFIIANPSI